MGKTTVFIDEKLLESAIKAINAKSKKEAIEKGLKELVHRKNIEALRKELGTYDLVLTLDGLDKLRKGQ
ncbi:MAG: type II toxin-antitoxin system VapB family antitoxin [Actinomycetota bacterium]